MRLSLLLGLAALAGAAQAAKVDCYIDPATDAAQCVDPKKIKLGKDGIRRAPLISGGTAKLHATSFTIAANCKTGVLHLKDQDGVSFAGGTSSDTAATRRLFQIMCEAP